jgi:hypothetical protein
MGFIIFMLDTLFDSVTKVPDMRSYQNEHNMLLNFPRCVSILLLQTSKTDNNALDIALFITSNSEKHNLIQQTALLDTKLNAKFPWPSIMPKHIFGLFFYRLPHSAAPSSASA